MRQNRRVFLEYSSYVYDIQNCIHVEIVVLPLVPSCRGEAGLLVTPKYGYFVSIGLCCWPFLSTFLPPLPFSHHSSRSPPIFAEVFLVFCNLLASLSRIFSLIYHLSI